MNILKKITPAEWVTAFITLTAIVLIVVGLLCPPPGEIHNSVLIGIGELFGFAALWSLIFAIRNGSDAKVTHGDTTIEINNPDADE